MKTYTIVFLLLIFCLSRSQAQQTVSPYQPKIDSLQTLIDRQPKDDTLTVVRLNYLARICFYDMQYKRGLRATTEARQLAKKLHYAKGEGMYLRTMATLNRFLYIHYYYDYEAKWFYTDRKQPEGPITPGVEPPPGRNAEKIKAALLEAIAYFAKQPDKEIMANLLNQSGVYGPSNASFDSYKKAVALFREIHQPVPAAFITVNNILIYGQLKKLKETQEAEVESLNLIAAARNSRGAAHAHFFLGQVYSSLDRIAVGFEHYQKADQILEQLGEKDLRSQVLRLLGLACHSLSLEKKAVEYFKKETVLREATQNDLIWTYHKIAFTLITLKDFEQAKYYIAKTETVSDKNNSQTTQLNNKAQHYDAIGQVQMGEGHYLQALQSFDQASTYTKALAFSPRASQNVDIYLDYYRAQCYQKLGNLSESIRYAKLSYDLATRFGGGDGREVKQKVSLLLAENYEQTGQSLEAFNYLKTYHQIRTQTDQRDAANRLMDLEVQSVIDKEEKEKNRLKQEQLLQQQHILAIEKQGEIDQLKAQATNQLLQAKAEQAELDKKLQKERLEAKAAQSKRQQDYQISLLNLDINTQRKVRTGLLGGLALFALFVIGLVRQNRARLRFNKILTTQKTEIESQRDQLNQTLTELQTTQAQLIQKEKLASLGELTAGIAHEIQNPLNFVNNFSEVSAELVEEQKEALANGDVEEARFIADDLSSNLRKIHHHGGRAAAIVRGMLEHSRTDTGERRPTDLNALAGEYLNIAYHGLRAKDKNFNCALGTDFEADLERVIVAPQEIGRVLLNLYNNAFYAVAERAKQSSDPDYKPTVEVQTQRQADQVIIRVRDNGTGIPDAVKAKIFQPFFTTKPTGDGTGLGLSLSYDIITKGHGGTLTVESREGEGTEFVIRLPG